MSSMLKFLLSADDRSGAAFKSVSGNLKNIKGAMAGIDERARRVSATMGKWGAIGTAGLTAPATLFAREAVQLFDVQARAEAAVRGVVESTGGTAGFKPKELFDIASGLQAITTYGDETTLQNVTTPLLTFTKIAGPQFERAQLAVLNMSTALGTDLRSGALQVGKALNDPVKGIGALSRAGIQFSKDQKDTIAALVKTGQVAKAQGIILNELDTQFGGQAAAAAKVGSASLTQLGNAIGDVKEQLGGEIVGFLPPLVKRVQSAVAWFSDLAPEVKNNIVVFGGLAAAGGPLLALLGAATFGVTALAGAVGSLGALVLANPILAGVTAIAGAAYLIYRNWEPVVGFMGGVWDRVRSGVGAAGAWISNAVGSITPEPLKGLWSALPAFFAGVWGRVKSGVVSGWDEVKSILGGDYSPEALVFAPWRVMGAFFEGMAPEVVAGIKTIWDQIKAEVSTWPDRFFEWGAKIPKRLLDGIKSFGTIDLKGIFSGWGTDAEARKNAQIQGTATGKSLAEGLAAGVVAGVSDVTTAGDFLGKSLEDATRDYLGIQSPSKVFQEIGGHVADGLALGIGDGADKVTGAVVKATGGALNAAKEAAHGFAGPLASAFAVSGASATTARERFASLGTQLLDMVTNKALTDFFSAVLNGWGPTKSAGAWLSGGGSVVANADGNVFQGGRVVPFARGGVVSSPTRFGMSGGNTGLMGEAGPEAILPLSRIGGKLGVRAANDGGGGSGAVNLEVHVHTGGVPVEVESVTQSSGRVDVQLRAIVNNMVSSGELDRSMRRYGVRPSATGV